MSALVLIISIALFRLAEWVHPITAEQTVAWLMFPVFVLLACGLADLSNPLHRLGATISMAGLLLLNTVTHWNQLELEGWHHALAQTAATPNGILLVQGESMTVIARRACQFEFSRPDCPFPVIAIRTASPMDSWAQGMAQQPLETPAAAISHLKVQASVFGLHHGDYDPLMALGQSTTPRSSWNLPFVEGPFARASFAAHKDTKNEVPSASKMTAQKDH